jgi:hypothetical protein
MTLILVSHLKMAADTGRGLRVATGSIQTQQARVSGVDEFEFRND